MSLCPAIYVTALLALTVPALGQMDAPVQMQMTMPCWPHPVVMKMLGDQFKEVPHSFGITKKSLVELYVSPTGSFTILRTAPLGLTCVVESGEGWELLPPAKYGDPT